MNNVMETTFDGLLNKRIWLEQPAEGFRIAVDTVLLAAAVPGAGRRMCSILAVASAGRCWLWPAACRASE